MLKLINSRDWIDFIGDRNIKTISKAKVYIKDYLQKSYSDTNYGFYVIEIKESKQSIGIAGFVKRIDLNYPDVGYALIPEFYGKGYAYECVLELLKYGKLNLNFSILSAITEERNFSSIKLLQKLNFIRKGNKMVNEEELAYFEIKL